jgi:A/G-specific adenine glycosylase
VIAAWGRLGYPRRARRLWESAVIISERGWPDDLTTLPGVGRYTAAAIRAQADDADEVAAEVNIRRVAERAAGRRLTAREAEQTARDLARPLTGRDRLLALMDVGALLCKPRDPKCNECPIRQCCTSQGPRDDEKRRSAPKYEGSFRQRRGEVLARLRAGAAETDDLDAKALASLVDDGLAAIEGTIATLPSKARQGGGGSPTREFRAERSSAR